MTIQEHLLDDFSDEKLVPIRRRSLLPIWMRIFIWVFIILGIFTVPLFVLGLSGFKFYIGLYGLEATNVNSFVGTLLVVVFLFKCVVSFCLWFEKKQAIVLGLIDAIAGIVICIGVMFDFQNSLIVWRSTIFRPEIIFLILYLIKLILIKTKWEVAGSGSLSQRPPDNPSAPLARGSRT